MQRLHAEDMIGHLSRKEGFELLALPSIATEETVHPIGRQYHRRRIGDVLQPNREPKAVLDDIRSAIGEAAFEAQYQQQPVPAEGHMVKWEWFRSYDRLPPRRSGDVIAQSWDTAAKTGDSNDWSVCTTWLIHGQDCHLVDVYRERHEFPALKRMVVALADRHQADMIVIEDTLGGTALAQEVRATSRHRPSLVRPEGDKRARLYAQTILIEKGQVHLPVQAPWLTAFRQELLAFPHGRHDDQVDSLSQFLFWFKDRNERRCCIIEASTGRILQSSGYW